MLRSSVLDAQGAVVAQVETSAKLPAIQQTLLVKERTLWSVDEPNLYTLLSEVLVNDEVVDSEQRSSASARSRWMPNMASG